MRKTLVLFILVLAGALAVSAQPLQPGEAVATGFSHNAPNGPVVRIFDIRKPKGHNAPLGQHWTAAFPPVAQWTRAGLGNNEVFGIALDDAPKPNIYVTSTTIYKTTYFSNPIVQAVPGTGQVWRIDGTTGVASLCVTLPQSTTGGQGLGNIAYNARNKQLFVTDFYDGKIHRIGTNCQIIDAYDPFQPFGTYANTAGGFAPLGERLWGVGVFQDRLYFARWSGDQSPGPANTVLSVPLDATGKPVGTPILEVTPSGTMPVSDIEFASDGRMLLAQRSMNSTIGTINNNGTNGEAYSWAHQSELLEYKGASGSWVLSGNVFQLGDPGASVPRSSAGGAAYACPAEQLPGDQLPAEGEYVVATGDALIYPSPKIYGLQIMPFTGGNKNNSYLVDLDGQTSVHDKTQIGDVDVYNICDRNKASLTVTKKLAGAPAGFTGTFKFYVTCSTPNGLLQQTLSVTWPNTAATLTGLPAGSVCTVSEDPTLPALPAGSSWSGVPVSTPANGVIKITKDGKNQITFTNTVRTCDDQGKVKITKRVEGVPPGFTGTFNFNVTCWSGTTLITKQAQITIPGSSTVTVTGVPIGSSCTVTETGPLPSLPAGWLWLAPTYQPASSHVDLEGNCCPEVVVVDRAKFCCNQSHEEGYSTGYDTDSGSEPEAAPSPAPPGR